MATLTLKQLFQQTPEVAELIDSFSELVPGVPASSENLECLLKVIKNGGTRMFEKQGDEADQGLLVKMMTQGKKRIICVIDGPAQAINRPGNAIILNRTNLVVQGFDSTVVGMSECCFRQGRHPSISLGRHMPELLHTFLHRAQGTQNAKVLKVHDCSEHRPAALECISRAHITLTITDASKKKAQRIERAMIVDTMGG